MEELFCFSNVEPSAVLRLAAAFSHMPGTCLLFSGSSFDAAEKSFLWAFPWDTLTVSKGSLERHRASVHTVITPTDMWQALKEELQMKDPELCSAVWSGYFGYEMGRRCPAHFGAISTSDMYLGRCCLEAVYTHRSRDLIISIDRNYQELLPDETREICQTMTKKKLIKLLFDKRPPVTARTSSFEVVKPFEGSASFADKVACVHESIRAGEVYQLNLSCELLLHGRCDPFALFMELVRNNEASFFSFIKLKEYAVVSASPERLLRRKEGQLESRPIKGTRPRGRTESEDRVNRQHLDQSEKECAELAMIVDLMRNDMSRVSYAGSVAIKEFRIEDYRHLFHRLAIIQAQSKPLHAIDILKNVFPGGSVTGCPKYTAMERIAELEQRRRGIYTGAIGYITPYGDFDFSVAIRTAVVQGMSLSFAVGSGIVIDSDPYQEYEEMQHKAKSLLEALDIRGKVL